MDDSAAPHTAPPPPPPTRRRPRRGWLVGLLALGLLLAALLAGLAALPTTARGSRLLLSWVPGLTVTGPKGALWGDFSAERVDYALSATQTLTLQPLRWQGLGLVHEASQAGGWRLHLARLDIERLALTGQAARATDAPTTLPTELVLPVGLAIDALRIGRIELDALGSQPVREVQLALQLGAGRQAQHRIDRLQLQWERLRAEGQLQLQAVAPMALAAQLALAPGEAASGTLPAVPPQLGDDWQAQLKAQGPLARFNVDATLHARGQSLDATAQVQPQTALGVTSLTARAQRFDLAAFSAQWPRTAWTGTVEAQLAAPAPAASAASTASSEPLANARPVTVTAALRNELAGRLDAGALPLRSLSLTARSAVSAPRQGRIESLTAEFGSSTQAAGTLDAQGTWRPTTPAADAPLALELATRWRDLRPALIDARAPALRLGGTLQLGWQSNGSASARGDLRGEVLDAQAPARTATADAPPARAARTIQLRLDAEGTPEQVQLRLLEASAGGARATAQGQARRGAQGWAAQLSASLQAFDPSLWLPLPNPTWRRGPHRLDGQLQADLRWPSSATPSDGLGWLAAVQGEAGLQIAPSSMLAGVPVAGQLRFAHAGATPPQASGRFTLGRGAQPGELTLDGQLDTRQAQSPQNTPNAQNAQTGAADRWTLRWKLPALAPLSPWLALVAPPGAAPDAPGRLTGLSGDLEGELQLTGRWPRLQASGRLASQSLTLQRTGQPGEALRGLAARGQAGTRPDDTVALDLRIAGATLGSLKLEGSSVLASGTGAAHRLQVATGAVLANEQGAAPRRLRADLQAEGGWQPARGAAPGWGWQGRLAQLEVRDAPPPAGAGAGANSAARNPADSLPWLRLQPTGLRWLQQGSRREFNMDATRLQVSDATLALEPVQWQQDGHDGPRLTLAAQLQPWTVAPLLARLQPGFGWRGDLRLAGRVALRAVPGRFQANVALARESGDLQVQDADTAGSPAATSSPSTGLGLSELRLALQADNGQWRLSEQIVGSRLGRLAGEVRLQTSPAAWVPPADAPLTGQLDLQGAQLAQLGQLGPWLPAGWRLSGALEGQVRLGGQLGAPRLSGELQGRKIAVRNLLEGIDWHDADLRLALDGDRARLDQFQVLAGTGRLTGSGTAQLGATPRLDLRLRAERFAALQRVDRRVVLSGDAAVMLDAQATRVNANLTADEARIDIGQSDAPSLADDVQVRRDGAPAPSALDNASGPGSSTRPMQLDIRADLGPAFLLRGRGVNARLTGRLQLTSPNNRLQLNGTVRAVDGNYAAYGQKLGIERGLVSFNGAIDNPRLDILALRSDLDEVRVGVAITGTAQGPRVRLYSDPEMSDTDKLSWLMLGRASDGLGGTDVALLQRAAYALLAGESDSPGVVQRLGLDNVSVGQKDDGTVRETVVSLGKQLSRRWYLGYERSLQTTTGSWQLIYRLAQRFTLRAQSGTAENALDVIWTWRWGR